jgi:thiol-disulfide isomerase/thioredoxin
MKKICLSIALSSIPLFCQGVYLPSDKPDAALCSKVEINKTALNFGAPGVGNTGGKVGADTIGIRYYQQGSSWIPQGQRKNVSSFSVVDSNSKTTLLSDLKGKVVLVGLWSTTCQPSAKMLMEFSAIYDKREKFGFEILAVNFDEESWKKVIPFKAKNASFFEKMPVYIPGIGEHGPSQFMDIVYSLPALFAIDREGNLASIALGYEPNFVAKNLSRLISEKPKAAVEDK